MLENFKQLYKISDNFTPVPTETLEAYENKVPSLMIDLWKSDGFGKYNNGVIEMIHPTDFEPSLWSWLGKEVDNYVPFAITGFGELFYYRKLTEEHEDVCLLDIQYRNIEMAAWELESFFEDILTDEEIRTTWLREDLFHKAISEKGKLSQYEVFTFAPVLAMGGKEELNYLEKGNALVYQEIVFQMTT